MISVVGRSVGWADARSPTKGSFKPAWFVNCWAFQTWQLLLHRLVEPTVSALPPRPCSRQSQREFFNEEQICLGPEPKCADYRARNSGADPVPDPVHPRLPLSRADARIVNCKGKIKMQGLRAWVKLDDLVIACWDIIVSIIGSRVLY